MSAPRKAPSPTLDFDKLYKMAPPFDVQVYRTQPGLVPTPIAAVPPLCASHEAVSSLEYTISSRAGGGVYLIKVRDALGTALEWVVQIAGPALPAPVAEVPPLTAWAWPAWPAVAPMQQPNPFALPPQAFPSSWPPFFDRGRCASEIAASLLRGAVSVTNGNARDAADVGMVVADRIAELLVGGRR